MIDLNSILLFIACLSPLVVLARTWKRAVLNRGWRNAALSVLFVTAVAWILAPKSAGFIGGGAWLALLLLPAAGLRRAIELTAQQRHSAARRIVGALRFLHPARALRDEHTLLHALELAEEGDRATALRLLDELAQRDSRAGLQANAQQFRIRGDWNGLVAFCRQNLPLVALGRDPALLPLYFRALGETGALDELVIQVAGRAPALLASPEHQPPLDASIMVLLAFCGRTDALKRLIKARLPRLHPDAKEFWIGTSERVAGDPIAARARLERLRAQTGSALIRAEVAQRLSSRAQLAGPLLTLPNESTVQRFERNVDAPRGSFFAPQRGISLAVSTFIALNTAMFLAEIWLGGPTNTSTLHRLGALEPYAVLARGEYWRLLASLFLHYGALHLLFNCYALYILGPPLENTIGTAKFALSYLLAGLGSSVGVVLLWRFNWTEADFLVGASGSVMGIVGAWAGLLIRHHNVPTARRRLKSIALIVILQTAFDLYTPQVSMAAHLCGLATGLIVGLLLAPRRLA